MSRLAGANAWLFSAAASTPWKAVFGAFWRGLPFPVGELHSDNGSEFLNNHLLRIWGEEITGLRLSRSRPYQKNDNRFVEQKNATLVRAFLGQIRLDTPAHTDALYDQMWVYYNVLEPVLRLWEKGRSDQRIIRRWDRAQTPLA